jgi:hypothetical protein
MQQMAFSLTLTLRLPGASRRRAPVSITLQNSGFRSLGFMPMGSLGRGFSHKRSGHRCPLLGDTRTSQSHVESSKMMLWTAPTLRHRCAKGWFR